MGKKTETARFDVVGGGEVYVVAGQVSAVRVKSKKVTILLPGDRIQVKGDVDEVLKKLGLAPPKKTPPTPPSTPPKKKRGTRGRMGDSY